MARAGKVKIDRERCKGCALCSAFCPKKIIKPSGDVNSFGYHPAEVRDLKNCTGCGICALVCPDVAIIITRKEEAA